MENQVTGRKFTPTALPEYQQIPEHQPVPACHTHLCRVCQECGKVHHGGGTKCMICFGIDRLGWPESMRQSMGRP